LVRPDGRAFVADVARFADEARFVDVARVLDEA
jgi:hypothetical protein